MNNDLLSCLAASGAETPIVCSHSVYRLLVRVPLQTTAMTERSRLTWHLFDNEVLHGLRLPV